MCLPHRPLFLCTLQELEQRHQGQHILLVSHGDTLSILQATFHRSPLTQHRQYGLATAELKCLNPAAAVVVVQPKQQQQRQLEEGGVMKEAAMV